MHTDPELLSLLALGEHVGSDADRHHAQTCRECAAELSELHRLVVLGRSVDAGTAMAVPSESVWARIRDELALEPTLEAPLHRSMFLPPSPPEPLTAARTVDATPTTNPVRTHPQRSFLATVKAALAKSPYGSTDALTAHAALTPVEAFWSGASGHAELATDQQGRRILQVALQADLPSSGVRQAWLIHRDDPTLRQTLGILDGPKGLWTVDKAIDLKQFAILDISQQGTGETEHSGHTIVRGQLTLVS